MSSADKEDGPAPLSVVPAPLRRERVNRLIVGPRRPEARKEQLGDAQHDFCQAAGSLMPQYWCISDRYASMSHEVEEQSNLTVDEVANVRCQP